MNRHAILRALAALLALVAAGTPATAQGEAVPGAAEEVRAAPAPAVTALGLRNLTAFSRLYGHIRFFNPSDESASTDFEALAVRGVRIAAGATSPEDLAVRLQALLRPLAATLVVAPAGAVSPPTMPRAEPGAPVQAMVGMAHEGFAFPDDPGVFESVRRQAALDNPKMQSTIASPMEPLTVDLGAGVEAAYFAGLWVDSLGRTLPLAEPADEALLARWEQDSPLDETTAKRIASVVILWNAVWHFAPYIEQDWTGQLLGAIQTAWEQPPEDEPLIGLRTLLAALRDSQAAVYPHGVLPLTPRLRLALVDGRIVVVAPPTDAAEADGLARGDVIVSIGGMDAERALDRAYGLVSAAREETRRARALEHLLAGGRGTWFEFESVGLDGVVRARRLERTVPLGEYHPNRPSRLEIIAPGVLYVVPSEFDSPSDLANEIRKVDQPQAVIADLRGAWDRSLGPALGFWLSSPQPAPPRSVPTPPLPDRAKKRFLAIDAVIQPKPPRLVCPLVVLVDETTAGDSEMDALVVQRHGLGVVLGARTGGTAGTTTALPLAIADPKCLVMWTQMRVTGYGGAPLYGAGVIPDIDVERTIAGIRAGRDETLDAALAIVRAGAVTGQR